MFNQRNPSPRAMTISILLVDDSEVIRFLFTKSLERDPELRVVGVASNGLEAIELAKKLQPDMVLLDIDMPEMDGLTALPKIFAASRKSKVFIISGNSRSNATAAIESLSLGASEFILKPGAAGAMKPQEFNDELRVKIKAIVGPRLDASSPSNQLARPPAHDAHSEGKKLSPITALGRRVPEPRPAASADTEYSLQPEKINAMKALAIASSTGGPDALNKLFVGLKGKLLHIPIFITQHMPALFTQALAERISQDGDRPCIEGVDGDVVKAGMTYIAPGGYHMLIRRKGDNAFIQLTQDQPVNSCRPSADPMFASISEAYGRNVIGVVLTGIGNDGAEGAKVIAHNGGSVFAQDRATSVVYGMPKTVAEAGVCEAILPIDDMAKKLIQRAGGR
jgi:two-component system chemotaxis response regulator CheB